MDPKRSGTQVKPVLSRRRAFQGLGGGLAATLLGNSSVRSGAAPVGSSVLPALAPQSREPVVRAFELVAEVLDCEIMPGVSTRAWGYNGQTPGPELRVREGDTVRVTLRNRLPVPTTIHWHGIHLRPEMDGPAGLNQEAVAPGEEFVHC